jgi:hypothetical protein
MDFSGELSTHQQAMFSNAKVSAYEVAKLMRKLEINDLGRLRTYLQCFVDSQFYGAELFPLHTALNIETSRKIFTCTCFNLPSKSAWNLTYALFPVMPALYMLLKRRASFYKRAQNHDLACVREAFLFDMYHLYPNKLSWCFQLEQMLKTIGVDMCGDIASFPGHLAEFDETMVDAERVCFFVYSAFRQEDAIFFPTHVRC